jgi:hypothetical protein
MTVTAHPSVICVPEHLADPLGTSPDDEKELKAAR